MLIKATYRIEIFTVILISLTAIKAHTQNIIVSGKILDAKSGEPLEFASVGVMGKPTGTIANANGEFDFHILNSYENDSLVVSHVGYQSYRAKITDVSKETIVIRLKPRPVLLNEVVIHEKNLTAKEIVAKTKRNLALNYSTKPFCLQGFFREIEEENGKYVLLSEAAVDLYDKNFDGKHKRHMQESVDVREMRRSLRYSARNNRDNIGFALADLIENNDVRYNRGMLDTASNTYSLDTILLYNDRPVYGISASRGPDVGMLYIDTETFGLLKITMERKSRDQKKYYHDGFINKTQKRGQVWFRFTVEFDVYENKLYARRMHESELNEIYDGTTGQLQIASIETLEFIVTNILPGSENKNAKRLKYGLIIKDAPYHEDFWRNFNTLKLTPVDEKLIRDLEKDISLQEQFKKQNMTN
jgi:hypothetical protein